MIRLAHGVALVAWVAGCSSSGGGHGQGGTIDDLQVAGDLGEVRVLLHTTPDEPVLVGAVPVCTRTPGVRVTRVAASADSELMVTGFAVRQSPFLEGKNMLGSANGSLADNDIPSSSVQLEEDCRSPAGVHELVIELTTRADTTSDGLDVTYEGPNGEGRLAVSYEITVCASGTTRECKKSASQFGLDER